MQKMFLAFCRFSSHVAFAFAYFLFSSSFILHNSSFSLPPPGVSKRPARFVTWRRNCPNWANRRFSIYFSSFPHPWATGAFHLALPIGESLQGGDSWARCLLGAAIRRSLFHPERPCFSVPRITQERGGLHRVRLPAG